MVISRNTQTAEQDKFGGSTREGTYVRVSQFNSLVTEGHDFVGGAYPTDTSEVYTFKTGGSGGTTVAIVTIVYTDNTKDFISTATKT